MFLVQLWSHFFGNHYVELIDRGSSRVYDSMFDTHHLIMKKLVSRMIIAILNHTLGISTFLNQQEYVAPCCVIFFIVQNIPQPRILSQSKLLECFRKTGKRFPLSATSYEYFITSKNGRSFLRKWQNCHKSIRKNRNFAKKVLKRKKLKDFSPLSSELSELWKMTMEITENSYDFMVLLWVLPFPSTFYGKTILVSFCFLQMARHRVTKILCSMF